MRRARRSRLKGLIVASAIVVAGSAIWYFGISPRIDGLATLWGGPVVQPNVLFITVDTVRADRIGCYGYAGARTQGIDSLAASGVRFDEAYCQVPLTLPSHVSMFTGLYPPSTGVHINGAVALGPGVPTLAEAFRERGYRTGAFVGADVLDSAFGLARGFDMWVTQRWTGWTSPPTNPSSPGSTSSTRTNRTVRRRPSPRECRSDTKVR